MPQLPFQNIAADIRIQAPNAVKNKITNVENYNIDYYKQLILILI